MNDGPVGLARYCTLRSWISQWSYDDAHADAEVAGANVSVPVLVLGATADNCCAPSHSAAHLRRRGPRTQAAPHGERGPTLLQQPRINSLSRRGGQRHKRLHRHLTRPTGSHRQHVRRGPYSGAKGQSTARSVIFDILGDFVRIGGQEIRLKTLVSLGELMGVAAPNMRVLVPRMRDEGWFDVRREGRESIYTLTPRTRGDRGRTPAHLSLGNDGVERILVAGHLHGARTDRQRGPTAARDLSSMGSAALRRLLGCHPTRCSIESRSSARRCPTRSSTSSP